MHFCTAYIAIAGDRDQIIHRNAFDPVSWPEIEVLRHIHGDESVTEVAPFVHVRQDVRAERERLALKYGADAINACFPGRNPRMEIDAPEADIAYGALWKNPLTQLEETIFDSRLARPEPSLTPEGESKAGKKKVSEKALEESPF
jgi:hypothetical protein